MSKIDKVFVLFAISLLVPSTAIIQRYFGVIGVLGYITIASVGLNFLFFYKRPFTEFTTKIGEKQVSWLTTMTFLALILVFLFLFPIANSGTTGGGSDFDEALDIAATEMLEGRYPYYLKTYLDNPISPLPGAVILSVPFVLLGSSAYQGIFWLFVFFLSIKSYLKNTASALFLLWVILALSPIVIHQLVIGCDYISNSLYVLIPILWMTSYIDSHNTNKWQPILLSILLGIGLSSRANFLLLLPLLFSALYQKGGLKSAVKYTSITCVTFILVTVPFYLYDPQGFSPLHTYSKLNLSPSVLPFAGNLTPAIMGIMSLVFSFSLYANYHRDALLSKCAILSAFPVFAGIILSSFEAGYIDFSYSNYGVFFLFFGALPAWNKFCTSPK